MIRIHWPGFYCGLGHRPLHPVLWHCHWDRKLEKNLKQRHSSTKDTILVGYGKIKTHVNVLTVVYASPADLASGPLLNIMVCWGAACTYIL